MTTNTDHFNDFQRALVAGALTEASAGKQITMAMYGIRMLQHVAETGGGDLELQDLHQILAGVLIFVARTADANKCSMRDIALTAVAHAMLPHEIDVAISPKLSIMRDPPEQRRPYDQTRRERVRSLPVIMEQHAYLPPTVTFTDEQIEIIRGDIIEEARLRIEVAASGIEEPQPTTDEQVARILDGMKTDDERTHIYDLGVFLETGESVPATPEQIRAYEEMQQDYINEINADHDASRM